MKEKYYTGNLYCCSEEKYNPEEIDQKNFGKYSGREDLGIYVFTKVKGGYRELITGRVFGQYRMVLDPFLGEGYIWEKTPKTNIFVDYDDIRMLTPAQADSWISKYRASLNSNDLNALFDEKSFPLNTTKDEVVPQFGPKK